VLQRALAGAHTLPAEAAAYGVAFWASAALAAFAFLPCLVLLRAERAARKAHPGQIERDEQAAAVEVVAA
jgi:hypothetical protein